MLIIKILKLTTKIKNKFTQNLYLVMCSWTIFYAQEFTKCVFKCASVYLESEIFFKKLTHLKGYR